MVALREVTEKMNHGRPRLTRGMFDYFLFRIASFDLDKQVLTSLRKRANKQYQMRRLNTIGKNGKGGKKKKKSKSKKELISLAIDKQLFFSVFSFKSSNLNPINRLW